MRTIIAGLLLAALPTAAAVAAPQDARGAQDAPVTDRATAPAPDGFPSEPPANAAPRDFALPQTTTYSLRNGMRVTLVPYGNVPKVLVRGVVRVGNLNDGDQPYIADLTADLMTQGAGDLDAAGLAERAAGMGGSLGIGVGADRTFLTLDVLSEHVADAIGLMGDVLREPTLPEGELDRLKADLTRNLSVARSQPGTQADEAFGAILYPGHPYAGQLPTDEQVAAYTLDDVARFHRNEFGARRTHLYVVGRYDERQVRRAVRRAFRRWEEGAEPLVLPVPEPETPRTVLIDRPGAVQSTIRLGLRVPPEDGQVDLAAADTLLGGYFSSRITRNIREDKGYTYSPYSYVDANKEGAAWAQAADIQIESTGPAVTEILSEIERLRAEAPSDEEAEAIRNYMSGIFVVRLAGRGGVAAQLAYADLHGLGADYLEGYVGKVRALTPEALRAAAEAHLDPAAMSLVVVGDTGVTAPQIREVALFGERLDEEGTAEEAP